VAERGEVGEPVADNKVARVSATGTATLMTAVRKWVEYSQMKSGDHHRPNGHSEHSSMPTQKKQQPQNEGSSLLPAFTSLLPLTT
jgi:hypothetical protein